ncbi:MAG TPA: glycosyltransferase family 4 protein, partial [Candidatus Edwardsbacteria bacterium]|nr:glycosyltransferase family 4 protein [Candidatus Edwardsbacteria bacterium]
LNREPRRPWNPRYLKNLVFRALPGRLISWATEKCYGATVDCAELAVDYFGVQRSKIAISPLGVDTERFRPPDGGAASQRDRIRQRFGFLPHEIVCVYTGRFTPEKNPLLLAQAVAALRAAGEPYRGLFVGGGTQAEAIASCEGCAVQPFVPVQQLAPYFWASEIGVWPTQESMSMLDAAACGLPIVVNDTMRATERIEGNGIAYRLNDRDDLVRALRDLRSEQRRRQLGDRGALRMARDFSWTAIARQRLADYQAALSR